MNLLIERQKSEISSLKTEIKVLKDNIVELRNRCQIQRQISQESVKAYLKQNKKPLSITIMSDKVKT